jgi:hypothetical protein
VWDVLAAGLSIACIDLTCGGTSAAEPRDAGAVATYEDPAAPLATLDRSAIAAI